MLNEVPEIYRNDLKYLYLPIKMIDTMETKFMMKFDAWELR